MNSASRTPHPLLLVLTLGALTGFGPLSIDIYLPAFPAIAADFGVSVGRVQLSLAFFLFGFALGQVGYGPAADRYGRLRPIFVGGLLYIVSAVGCWMAGSVESLIFWRFVMGLGGAAGVVVARAVVRDLFKEEDSVRMYAAMMLVVALGPILAPLLGGQLVSHGGWRWIFVLLLAFGLVVMAAVARLLPESLPPERRISGAVPDVARLYAKLLGDVRFLGTAIPISFASAMLFSYIAGSSFVFIELNHLSPVEYSVYFSANAVGLFSVAQTNRWLLKRWHSRQILFAAFATNCGFALIFLLSTLAHWGGFPVLYVCLFGCMATLGLIFPNAAALTMMPFGREAGSVSSLMGTLQYGLGAGVGAIQGLWHDGTALPMAVMVLASSALGFGFLWVFQVSPTQVVAELESS